MEISGQSEVLKFHFPAFLVAATPKFIGVFIPNDVSILWIDL